MRSCLYEGRVFHRRSGPIKHAFEYGVAFLYLDLSEIDAVFRGGGKAPHPHSAGRHDLLSRALDRLGTARHHHPHQSRAGRHHHPAELLAEGLG